MVIKWYGKTTDENKKYNAQAESYEELYNNINSKYGYDTIFIDDIYERKLLEINNQNIEDYVHDDDTLDFEKFDMYILNNEHKELSELDYKEMIEESNSQAYYHNFIIEDE